MTLEKDGKPSSRYLREARRVTQLQGDMLACVELKRPEMDRRADTHRPHARMSYFAYPRRPPFPTRPPFFRDGMARAQWRLLYQPLASRNPLVVDGQTMWGW